MTVAHALGDSIELQAGPFTIKATIHRDDSCGTPWEECDGHGPVSDWTRRDKAPGERVLCEDGGSKRYYDVQEAMQIAKRDGWDAPPYTGTKGERAARAVDRDFQFLRGWCNDEWHYCGIKLSIERDEEEIDDHAASLWRIEMNAPLGNSYLLDVANELLAEIDIEQMVADAEQEEREEEFSEAMADQWEL